jgi:2-amino-4-hydroxy-6-hydroxymethyldihydropteridine diphosphokinase
MRAVLSLGSNLGDREWHLMSAAEALDEVGEVVAFSSFLENQAVGGPPQPDYLNAVLILDTQLEPIALLQVCQAIEQDFGRARDVHWGPRTLDIDIISCDNQILESPSLTLPHPRAHLREFVLVLWLEIDNEAHLLGRGAVAELLANLQQ